MNYVGKDGKPIPREVALAAFGDPQQRIVASDYINGHHISTVWLVIDHGFGGTPIPFETMIFKEHEGDCPLDGFQERYTTEAHAIAGHDRAVEMALHAPTVCGRL